MELENFPLAHGISLSVVCDNVFTNNIVTATLNKGDVKVQMTSRAVSELLVSYPIIKNFFSNMMFRGTVRLPLYGDSNIIISVELCKEKDAIGQEYYVEWRLIFHNPRTTPAHFICSMSVCRECLRQFTLHEDRISNAIHCWQEAKHLILLQARNALIYQDESALDEQSKTALRLLMTKGAYINDQIMNVQPVDLQEKVKAWCFAAYRPGSDAGDELSSCEESDDEHDVFQLIVD